MVDIRAFLRKHKTTAVNQGVGQATTDLVSEAAIWTYSELHGQIKGGGRLIWEDEWDICCIADATRWDQWQEVAAEIEWLPDDGECGWSVGSCSPEWYGKSFDPAVIPDGERIGIVTANPFAAKPAERVVVLDHTPLHENPAIDYCDYVFQDGWGCEIEGGYVDVAHPAMVTDRAYDAWQAEDLDRLVVHYMQPHIPFRSRPEWFGKRENLRHFGEPEMHRPDGPYQQEGSEIWKRIKTGERGKEEVWEAYCDNLVWALEHIDRLRRGVDAEMLISSDHGNAIGEYGLWSHPPQFHIPALRRVPWVSVDGVGGEFREHELEETKADRSLEDKLAALGYLEEAADD